MDKKAIHLDARGVVDSVKKYVGAQADIWRRIPNLALEANGRSGYDGKLSGAYEQGVWQVSVPTLMCGHHYVYVDCANGDLLDVYHFQMCGQFIPAEEGLVLIASTALDLFDASAVAQRLIREADQPYAPCFDAAKQEAWRADVRRQYGLGPMYSSTPKRRI